MRHVQHALREILVIALGLAVIIAVADHRGFTSDIGSSIFATLVLGLLLSVPAWIAYRLGRFVVLPRRR